MSFPVVVFLMKLDVFLFVSFYVEKVVFLFWSACNPFDMDCSVLVAEKRVNSRLLLILHLHLSIYYCSCWMLD